MKKLLTILSVALCFFAYSNLQAQACNAPIINSFSPNTGFIGSTVTVFGANFDAIPANNQVFFGATQATVLTASFGVLTVTVPVGSTTSPISVKNSCNLTAYSPLSFNGIFCPTPLTSTTYQNVAFTLAGVTGAYNMLSQDIDGDGKPDIVSEGFGSNFTIARNTSTPGNMSFTGYFLSSPGPRSVAVADFDGDGKRDILSNGYVHRNLSTPGTVSMSAAIYIGNTGYQCAAGDINGDGKIDAISGNGNTIIICFNTSSGPGNISFAAPISALNSGGSPTGLQMSDIDGDGKVDILGTQGNNNRAFSFRNITAVGSFTPSFEAVEYWNSNGTYPYRCQIADFDKDGKIDLTTCNYQGATNTAVFRNTSTPGDISFANAFTTPAPGANYRVAVGDVNGDGLPDIVTKSLGVNVFSVYPNTSTGPGVIAFGTRIDYTSSAQAEVSGIVIGDLDGDFVPDIATSGINSGAIRVHRNTSSQVDNTAPTALCKNITVALSPAGSVNVTANMIDNGSGDACGIGSLAINNSTSVTFTCANIGPNTVTLTVTDRAGNVSTCTATVTVAPAAIIVAGQTTVCQGQTVLLNANLGDSYQWQKDGVDIVGATSQTYTATVSGNYTVTVTNAGGCSGTSAPTTITVNNNPTVNTFPSGNVSLCPPANNLVISASTSSIYQWKLNGNNIPGATQQNYTTTSAGTYSVQVVDLFGCSATSAPVLVNAIDNIAPTAKCKNVTVIINAGGTAGITVADINDGSFDNCTVASVVISSGKTSYTCADAGQTFPVTITVTDGSGNSSSCTAQVSVTDPNTVCNQPPVAVCKALTLSAGANCDATAVAAAFDGGSTDADAGDVLTFSVSPAGPYAIGTTTVTFTVTDSKGASSSCVTTVTVADNEAPKANCKSAIVTLANGSASITVGDVNDNSSDNCGIASITLSKTSFSCSDIGANTVTLTVTDIHGNVSTCTATVTVVGEIPSCSIASIPTSNIYTGGVSTNLYLGYGAQSTTLNVTAPASGAPYTYAWSGPVALSGAAPVFTPVTAGQYTFTVVTTNKYGCTTSCSITICVTDIRVPGSDGKKVFVCHVPPGNPANWHTLSISVNAVPAHLGNHTGDRLGSCDQKPCGGVVVNAITQAATTQATKETPIATTEESFTVNVSPNPSANYFTLKLVSKYATPVNLKVLDANGRVLDTKSGIGSNGSVQVGHNYSSGTYYAELIQGNTRKVVQLIKASK